MARRPLQEPIGRPGVHDRAGIHPGLDGLLAAETEPLELAGRMSVGVDTEPAAELDGELEKLLGRIASFGVAN